MSLKTVKLGAGSSGATSGNSINNQETEQANANFYISGSGRMSRLLIGNQSEIGDDQGSTPTKLFINVFDSDTMTSADGNLFTYGGAFDPEISKISGADGDGVIVGMGAEARIGALNTKNWSNMYGSIAVYGSVNIQVGATGILTNGASLKAGTDIGGMQVRYSRGLLIDPPYVHGTGEIIERFAIHIKDQGTIGSYDNWGILNEDQSRSVFFGRIGVGLNYNPSVKSILDLTSTTQGFLPPRMTKAQRDAITSVPQGLEVFVTDNGGYLSWYNSGWQKVTSTAD